MNILISGGAGFIGSNLVRLLLKNQHKVRIIDNLSTGYQKNIQGLAVDFTYGDVRDSALVENLCNGVDVVFHLAASVGRQKSLEHPQEDAEVNLVGTTNVLEGARKCAVKRVVYTSSAAIFGELLTMPIAEEHPQNPDSPYGVSKLAGEKQALCYAGLYGLQVVCLRYFNVYGVHQRYDAYGNVIPIFAERIFKNEPLIIFGDGEQTRDFVNVKDVAMANYLAAFHAKQNGVYNIGCGKNITINELARLMIEISGKPNIAIQYASKRPTDVRHCRADISKAKQDFGYSPDANLFQGLQEYWQWFESNGE